MKEEIKSKISDKIYPSELEQLKTREEVVNATSKIVRSYYDKRKNE